MKRVIGHNSYKWRICILILWFFMCLTQTIFAQNNSYKIDDELYQYFIKINSNIKKDQTLAVIDTMYAKSIQKKDAKGQCLAISMRCNYYATRHNYTKTKQIIEKNKSFLLTGDNKQYYFYALGRIIYYKISMKKYTDVMNDIEQYKDEAFKYKNTYAIGASYRYLGIIYWLTLQRDKAIENYTRSAEYLESAGETKDIHQSYTPLIVLYMDKGNDKMVNYYLEKANKYCRNSTQLFLIYNQILNAYCSNGNVQKATQIYNEINSKINTKKLSWQNKQAYYTSHISYFVLIKDYQKALSYTDTLELLNLKYKYKSKIYEQLQNYEEAYMNLKIVLSQKDSTSKKELAESLSKVTNELNEQRLTLENGKLELQNAQMKLKQSEDQKLLLAMTREQDMLTLNNSQLELSNKNMKIRQAEMELNHKQKQLDNEINRNQAELKTEQTHKLLLIIISLTFLFSAIISLLFIRKRNTSIRTLKEEMIWAENMKQEAERQKIVATKERERTEKALMEANEARSRAQKAQVKAESADKLKSLFLQNMSHEIRTPMNAIVGFTDLLNNPDAEYTNKERNEFLQLIHINSELLTTLINDILDISKLESGNYVLNRSYVKVADLCTLTVASVLNRAAEGVDLRFDRANPKVELPDGTPATELVLHTDAARLQQILTNFLTNACKYTEKGSIVLTYEIHKNNLRNRYEVIFSVTDTGPGIPPEKAENIFERFTKLDNFKQGTGLGLNICKRISDLMNGEIKVDTNYTQGARFIFAHPLS